MRGVDGGWKKRWRVRGFSVHERGSSILRCVCGGGGGEGRRKRRKVSGVLYTRGFVQFEVGREEGRGRRRGKGRLESGGLQV